MPRWKGDNSRADTSAHPRSRIAPPSHVAKLLRGSCMGALQVDWLDLRVPVVSPCPSVSLLLQLGLGRFRNCRNSICGPSIFRPVHRLPGRSRSTDLCDYFASSTFHQCVKDKSMADGAYAQTTQTPDGREVVIPDRHTYYINIPIHPLTGQVADEHLERLSLYYTIYGVVFGIVGLVAILVPFFFKSLPLDQLVAWLLVVGGAVTLLQFFLVCGAPGTTSFLLLGALHLGVGIGILLQRVPNPTMLVFIVCGWFLVHGIIKLLMACQVRSLATWPAVLTSGLVSVILAFVLLSLSSWLFSESLKFLGVFIGGDLIFTALSLLLIAFMARLGKNAKETHQPLLAQHGIA